MSKNQFGVWEIVLRPDGDQPAIAHGSRTKLSMVGESGERIERVPAWITRAEQDRDTGLFEGIFWNPAKKFEFSHCRPPIPNTLKIYEAHVGIASNQEKIASYVDFALNVVPYIASLGYNAIQLMAIMEHPYYASFGYQVTSFFAPSSRFGDPEDLKLLIDTAHSLGLLVLLDVVHSHASKNVLDGLNGFDGSDSYLFHSGPRGCHPLWDSRLFDYANRETLRFLLSNLRYWYEEYQFDGFRFDGVTSMLYKHHGVAYGFTGNYDEYYQGDLVDGDALVYLQLANLLLHRELNAMTIAEDVSGMPLMCIGLSEGGIGFDYRLAMSIPDMWIGMMKQSAAGLDDSALFDPSDMAYKLCNRRYRERVIAYAECHDQALVGDKTLAFWLMDAEMYSNMSVTSPPSLRIERGLALHKLIRLVTYAMGGEAYLTFMGNEFGHPEWLDFPRAGNNNSFKYARRLFHLKDEALLRYKYLLEFDRALLALPFEMGLADYGYVSMKDGQNKVLVFERGGIVFLFNWHSHASLVDYRVGVPERKVYRPLLDSDSERFGGQGRVNMQGEYHAQLVPYCNRPYSIQIYLPCRTALVLGC